MAMGKKNLGVQIIRGLFDASARHEIIRFMDDFLPILPMASDLLDSNSNNKFNRRYSHNLPFFVDIHYQLTEFASEIFGEKVKPSYCFLSLYEKGGQCPLHIDRPQCRYTIDYLIRQSADAAWEIKIGNAMSDAERDAIENAFPQTDEEKNKVITGTSWTSAMLDPNDAVCYSGTNSWHYRPEKSKGTADLIFWHFVPEGFSGSLN